MAIQSLVSPDDSWMLVIDSHWNNYAIATMVCAGITPFESRLRKAYVG